MSTDLTTYQPGENVTTVELHRPDLNEWAANLAAAHTIGSALCTTSFAPAHFRGKPDEAAAAILYGSEVGFTPTQALQNLYVIGGKPALYARPMVAIVQAAGHEVWTEDKTDESVTVAGRRRGTPHIIRETWTLARAQRAGYTNNKKYQTDPQAMLYARAASDVCRQIAADALAGMAYSVEELQLEAVEATAARPRGLDAVRAAAGAPAPVEPETVVATVEAERPGDVDGGDPISDRTRRKMFALLAKVDPNADDDTQRKGMSLVLGREVTSRADLTEDDAHAVIAALQAELDRRDAAQTGGE